MSNSAEQHTCAADRHESLRGWARSANTKEAAVELLVRSIDGPFAWLSWLWFASRQKSGEWCPDADTGNATTGMLCAGEQGVLSVVATLDDSEPLEWCLVEVLRGVDRESHILNLTSLSRSGRIAAAELLPIPPYGTHKILGASSPFRRPARLRLPLELIPLSVSGHHARPEHSPECSDPASQHNTSQAADRAET